MAKNENSSSLNVGIGFGLASGVITTLGLMIGVYSSTLNKGHVLGAIFTIAIADAFSDAVGIHFSKESDGCSIKDIWYSTIITFIAKFFVSLTFVIPILIFSLNLGLAINIFWSYLLVGVFSFIIAKKRRESALLAILEHFFIMTIVIISTYYVGKWIEMIFLKN